MRFWTVYLGSTTRTKVLLPTSSSRHLAHVIASRLDETQGCRRSWPVRTFVLARYWDGPQNVPRSPGSSPTTLSSSTNDGVRPSEINADAVTGASCDGHHPLREEASERDGRELIILVEILGVYSVEEGRAHRGDRRSWGARGRGTDMPTPGHGHLDPAKHDRDSPAQVTPALTSPRRRLLLLALVFSRCACQLNRRPPFSTRRIALCARTTDTRRPTSDTRHHAVRFADGVVREDLADAGVERAVAVPIGAHPPTTVVFGVLVELIMGFYYVAAGSKTATGHHRHDAAAAIPHRARRRLLHRQRQERDAPQREAQAPPGRAGSVEAGTLHPR